MCDNTPCNARYQKDSVGSIPTYLRQVFLFHNQEIN